MGVSVGRRVGVGRAQPQVPHPVLAWLLVIQFRSTRERMVAFDFFNDDGDWSKFARNSPAERRTLNAEL